MTITGGDRVVERDDAQATNVLLSHQVFEVADAGHAVERIGGRKTDKAVGMSGADTRHRGIGGAEDAELNASAVHICNQAR